MKCENVNDLREGSVDHYPELIRKCSNTRDLLQARRIHHQLRSSGRITTLFLSNLLILMYSKCGSLHEAKQIFDSLPRRNIYSWSLMMQACSQNAQHGEVLHLYREMCNQGFSTTNTVVFLLALGASTKLGSISSGRLIHSHLLESGLFCCDSLHSSLINMYGRCGSCDEAKREFDRVETRNVVAWSAMISAYGRNGHHTEARHLLERMLSEQLQPNEVTYLSILESCGSLEKCSEIHSKILDAGIQVDSALGNALISAYSRCGSSEEAWKVFDAMKNRTIFSWNCMISSFAQQGENRKALQLYQKLEPEGVKANAVTYISALTACSNLRDSAQGEMIHQRIVASGYDSEVRLRNALLHLYNKCGQLKTARKIFDETLSKSLISWNAMMAAYIQNGQPREALHLYEELDVQPDFITFTTALDACSRCRDLRLGISIHQRLTSTGFDITTGNALITMYGRCGRVDQARSVFDAMEARDVITWTAIITAYAQNGHPEEALRVYHEMKSLPDMKPNSVTLISVVEACCEAKDLAQAREVHSGLTSRRAHLPGSLGNALINLYANCGSLIEARKVFDELRERDIICWSSIVAAYAQHGDGPGALSLLLKLCLQGVEPDEITLITILFACSHSGLVVEGRYVFLLMCGDFSCYPDVQHYDCLVDLLARAGWLEEARDLVENMPFEPDHSAYMSLLSSSNAFGDYQRGREAAEIACVQGLLFFVVFVGEFFKVGVSTHLWITDKFYCQSLARLKKLNSGSAKLFT